MDDPCLLRAGVQIDVLRLDQVHPLWGGNKWFKLAPNLIQARQRHIQRVLSFGGAHSNHLHALAAIGARCGIATVGIVRGECADELTPTLEDARAWGMELQFVSRTDYRRRFDPRWVDAIAAPYGPLLVIPEGGDNQAGFDGCRELGAQITRRGSWDGVALACGTGTTLAGLVAGGVANVLGVAALRDGVGISRRVAQRLVTAGMRGDRGYRVTDEFAGRGFARLDSAHITFLQRFEARHRITLDPVYTLKLFCGLFELVESGYFGRGCRILAVHSGGLQGRRAMAERIDRSQDTAAINTQ